MAIFHPQRQAILGILIIHSHPFMGITAQPSKKLIDFDVSEPPQTRVEAIPSEAYPGSIHYTTVQGSRHTHILGRVMDAEEILIDGDPTAMSRYVLVHPREDGMTYIRVTTRWRIPEGPLRTAIDEFVKRPEDTHYSPIIRTPIELNIIGQNDEEYIDVKVVVDWEEHKRNMAIGRTNGVFPVDLDTLPVNFTVQNLMDTVVTIGMVKFGDHLLEHLVEGLMEREVIWEGGLERPRIIIKSRYRDGGEIVTEKVLVGNKFHVTAYRTRPFLLCR